MNEQIPCIVTILDKEYRVACTTGEKQGLIESARYLDEKMKSLKSQVGVVGVDRLTVITALNITYEMLQSQHTAESRNNDIKNRLTALGKKIDASLSPSANFKLDS